MDAEARERLAIVGTGLMGGSLGLAVTQSGLFSEVLGFDVDQPSLQRALERGAITRTATSASEAAANAEVVFIATPVENIASVFLEMASSLKSGSIVTDVGSTKSQVVEQIAPHIPIGSHFIGGHPVAGAEQEGIDAAEPDLFRGCIWILTPTEATDASAYGTLVRIIGALGARVLSLDPARHDELLALTSHLPQLLSSTLMRFAVGVSADEGGYPLIGAGGFRDMTRIAASSPEMWVEIVRTNQAAVSDVMMRFEEALRKTREAVTSGNWGVLREALNDARKARYALGEKPGLSTAELIELQIPVPDRPGVLAEISTTVGEAGINIEDIDIVHSPEGGRGTIHLTIRTEEAASAAAEVISGRGYRVHTSVDQG